MTDPTSPDILEQALEMIDDIDAADFDELLQSVADNVVGTEPLSDTLLSDIPRTTPPRVGRTTSRSQRVARPLGSIRSGIRPGRFAARKSPRNPIPLSPQVRIVNPQNTPSTGRSSRRGGNGTPASSTYGSLPGTPSTGRSSRSGSNGTPASSTYGTLPGTPSSNLAPTPDGATQTPAQISPFPSTPGTGNRRRPRRNRNGDGGGGDDGDGDGGDDGDGGNNLINRNVPRRNGLLPDKVTVYKTLVYTYPFGIGPPYVERARRAEQRL